MFSPDSRRLAYIGQLPLGQVVVVDDEAGESCVGVLKSSLCFSPDSRRIAYGAKSLHEEWIVVIDGDTSEESDGFTKGGTLKFLSSNSVCFVARRGADIFRFEMSV